MLLKYIAQPSFTTVSGIMFNEGEIKEVSDAIGKTLLETFIGMFEDCSPKVEPKKPKVTE